MKELDKPNNPLLLYFYHTIILNIHLNPNRKISTAYLSYFQSIAALVAEEAAEDIAAEEEAVDEVAAVGIHLPFAAGRKAAEGNFAALGAVQVVDTEGAALAAAELHIVVVVVVADVVGVAFVAEEGDLVGVQELVAVDLVGDAFGPFAAVADQVAAEVGLVACASDLAVGEGGFVEAAEALYVVERDGILDCLEVILAEVAIAVVVQVVVLVVDLAACQEEDTVEVVVVAAVGEVVAVVEEASELADQVDLVERDRVVAEEVEIAAAVVG